jgi:hypothetical protein
VSHVEFPKLTPEAEKALRELDRHLDLSKPGWQRRCLAAFLRKAMEQARQWEHLEAIADNLHSPPPPPTLAQARAADLDTQDGKDVVRDFLATLGEGTQP